MKNLIDYIEECGEGCATLDNTMGMGNPMPPGEPGSPGVPGTPGTEPIKTIAGPKQEKIATSKRKKQKITESILEDDLGDNLDETIVIKWLEEHITYKGIKVKQTPKGEFEFDCKGYLKIYLDTPFPKYIKLLNIRDLKLSIELDDELTFTLSNLPTDYNNLTIDCYGVDELIIDLPSLNSKKEISIQGSIKQLVLPNKVETPSLSLSNCSYLEDMKFKNLITTKINLPRLYAGVQVRKAMKLGTFPNLYMNGNSMQ